MQTFDQHLLQLALRGTVSVPAAKLASTNVHDFSVMLKRAGVDPALVDAAS
jgi:twitching motility protein PilT